MTELIYPTINLFLYDLRDGLGQNPEEVVNNHDKFKQRFPENIRDSLLQFDTQFDAEYVELLGNQRIERFKASGGLYEGYYYPVRLGDTYGLLLDCSINNQVTPYPINCFADLKTQIDIKLKSQSASIGQTWMLTGHLPNNSSRTPESIAQACYNAFIPKGNWQKDFQGQGHLLGGTLFELWRYRLSMKEDTRSSSPPNLQSIQENHHVIIALYPDAIAHHKAAEFNFDWMRLFCYRNKILWAYAQSRYLKQQLKADFVPLQKGITDLRTVSYPKPKLKLLTPILEKAQNTLSRYSINISYFDYQLRNIEINLDNYKKRLVTLQEKPDRETINSLLPKELTSLIQNPAITSLISNSALSPLLSQLTNSQGFLDLKFLEKFSNDVEDKYLIQVQKDYENLSPGEKLLEGLMNSINSVRSLIEIDQQERDRNLQSTIAIVGVGLAAGSVVASICTQFPIADKTKALAHPVGYVLYNYLHISDDWLVSATSSVFIIGATILFGLLTWLVIWLWEHFFKR